MDAKRFTLATVVGGVVLTATAYVIFTLLVGDFYAANVGSATGVDREPQIRWATTVAALAYAALITYAMGRRGATSLRDGAMVGAIVGLLIWGTANFVQYGITNTQTLARTIVDPLIEFVHGGLGGMAIAAVLGRKDSVA